MSVLDERLSLPLSGAETRISPRAWYRFGLAGIGIAVLLLAIAPFVAGALTAAREHELFTGAVGTYPMDVLQYLAWVHSAHQGLISNLYGPGSAVFVHPIWSPSGWIQALSGVPDIAIIAFWTVAGALALLAGCVRLVRRHIPAERSARRVAAVVVALFGGLTPAAFYLQQFDPGAFYRSVGDVVPVATLWEYSPLAIAIGLMPYAIERLEAIAGVGAATRTQVLTAAALGGLVGWLHPWQGETLIVVALGLSAWGWRDRRGPIVSRRLLVVLGVWAVPLLYYFLLSRIDAGWAVSERSSHTLAAVPLDVFALVLFPIAVAWALSARRLAGMPEVRGLVLWPAAALLVIVLTPSGPSRAIDGLVLPVAVLVAKAWPTGVNARSRQRAKLWAAASLTAVLLPSLAFYLPRLEHVGWISTGPYSQVNPSDARAVEVAARRSRGGSILTSGALGAEVPVLTGRVAWVGHPVWTPDWRNRVGVADSLLLGLVPAPVARALIAESRVSAVVQPCRYNHRLDSILAPLRFREQTIGCAHIYTRGV